MIYKAKFISVCVCAAGSQNSGEHLCKRDQTEQSYSVGALQKALKKVWAHFLIVGDATGKEVAGATRVSSLRAES